MTGIMEELRANKERTVASQVMANSPAPTTFDEAYAQHSRMTRTERGPGPVSPGGMPSAPMDRQVPVVQPLEGEHGFGVSAKLGMIDDPDVKLDRLSEWLGIPRERVGFNDEGDPMYLNDDGHLQMVSGGFAGGAGTFAGATPEIAGGIVAGVTFAGARRPDAAAAAGAVTGLGLKKIMANMLWDDPLLTLDDLRDLGLEGLMDYAGSKVFKWGGKALKGTGVPGIGKLDPEELARQKQVYKNATGIDLDIAMLTNLPALKALKIYARNFPGESGEIIRAHDELVQGQVVKAINSFADTLSRSVDPARVGIKGINAATAAIKLAEAEVDRLVTPLYRTAFNTFEESGKTINTGPLIRRIDDLLKKAKGSRAIDLKKARKALMKNEPEPVPRLDETGQPVVDKDGNPVFDMVRKPENDLEGLHETHITLSKMLKRKPGDNPLDETSYRDITRLAQDLTGVMKRASPEYAEAMAKFEKAKRALVEPLENSVIGVLAKIPDSKAAKAAATMFTGGDPGLRMSALQIKRVRREFLKVEKRHPELAGSWDRLTADWVRKNLNEAMKPTQTGEVTNTAGKWLSRAFGTPQQQAALKAAVGPDAYADLSMLTKALQMAARTPTGSSATEFNKLITERMGDAAATFVTRVLRPRQSAMDAFTGRQLEKMTAAMAEAVTDPSKIKALNKIRAMTAGQERNLTILGLVFGSAINSGVEEMVSNDAEGVTQ